MGRKSRIELMAEEITRELEKVTGLTWEPIIFKGRGYKNTIEYSVEQYNLYFIFYVNDDENKPDRVRISKTGSVNISVDELYDLLDCINRICEHKHFLYFDLKEDREIYNIMDLLKILSGRTGYDEEASRDIVEKIEASIKKGALSVVDLNRMDKIDKHYREFLQDRDALIVDDGYERFVILFDND